MKQRQQKYQNQKHLKNLSKMQMRMLMIFQTLISIMVMKKQILISTFLGALLVTGAAQAASWQESLSSAANELTKESSSTQGGLSASSLTSLLGNSSQSLSAGTMNNAAGILEYCAKQKLASVTDAQNVKNQVLGKLGLDTQEQKADTNYMDGIQGLLNAQNGQQLNLSTLGNSSLAKQVKTKACDLVLKQGVNFIS